MPHKLANTQGAYFIATGLWPLVHMQSFVAVTGRKKEQWLVRTVGTLVTSIGATLLVAARRREVSRSIATLGATSALGLAAIELFYGTPGHIRRIYIADAALELAIAGAWMIALRGRSDEMKSSAA